MAVPAVPRAGLAVVEAEVILGPLNAFLDGPAQTGGACQLGKARGDGTEDKIVGLLLRVSPGPAD